ncbi:MAG: hypothetical protein ACYCW5_01245, partial [Thermoleophilia bacterium]
MDDMSRDNNSEAGRDAGGGEPASGDGLNDIIAVGRGDAPADLLIRDARVVDVLSGEIISTSVA